MPDPVTWYALGRTTADPELIMEMVDDKFSAHNQDPSAHGQTAEAVYSHRQKDELDHPPYSIYNIKLQPNSRTVKAFCDVGGACEFERIQDAINYVNGLTGGTVFIKEGIYKPGADLIMYSNIELRGADDDTTIIDFENGQYAIVAVGSSGNELKNIRIRDIQIYRPDNVAEGGIDFHYVWDSIIENCKFYQVGKASEDFNPSIQASECQRLHIVRNRFVDCQGAAIDLDTITGIWVEDNFIKDMDGFFLIPNSVEHGKICNNVGTNIDDYFIYSAEDVEMLLISGNSVTSGGPGSIFLGSATDVTIVNNYLYCTSVGTYIGIFLDGVSDCIISGNVVRNYPGDGIKLAGHDRAIVTGNTVKSCGGWGINVSDAACDNCVVVGNSLFNNTDGGVNDQGTGTELGHNKVS